MTIIFRTALRPGPLRGRMSDLPGVGGGEHNPPADPDGNRRARRRARQLGLTSPAAEKKDVT